MGLCTALSTTSTAAPRYPVSVTAPLSVIASTFEDLSPGGIFEFQEPSMPFTLMTSFSGTALEKFQTSVWNHQKRRRGLTGRIMGGG
jgi:hypothetical protein